MFGNISSERSNVFVNVSVTLAEFWSAQVRSCVYPLFSSWFAMSLILTIFALVLFAELVSWIGHSVLLDLAWGVCCRILYSALITRQRELKTELLTTKKELLQTSAQDQFAKWAKLRRSVDKRLAELEKLNGELASQKTAFSVKFNSLVWILTTGLQFVIGWWYRRSAVFYLPPGWFGPLTWWLALPFAPKGSVSVGVWQLACRRVIKVGERTVKAFMMDPGVTEEKGGSDGTSTSDPGKTS